MTLDEYRASIGSECKIEDCIDCIQDAGDRGITLSDAIGGGMMGTFKSTE